MSNGACPHQSTGSGQNFTCHPPNVKCQGEQKCIPKHWVCDGEYDCKDNSDELHCGQWIIHVVMTTHASIT